MKTQYEIRTRAAVLGCLAIVPFLGGCLDIENDVALNADGSAAVTTRLVMDEALTDFAKSLVALDKLEKEPKLQALTLDQGVCVLLSQPLPGTPKPVAAFREIKVDGKIVCETTFQVANLGEAMSNPFLMGVITFRQKDRSQTDFKFDAGRIPDMSMFVDLAMMQNAGKMLEHSGKRLPQDAVPHVRTLSTSTLRMLMSGRTIKTTLIGAKVSETNGAVSADGKRVSFTFPINAFIAPLVGSKSASPQSFRASIQH